MVKSVAIEVQGDLDALSIVWSVIDTVTLDIEDASQQEDVRYSTMVAVQEILTNIFRHAYGYNFDLPVRVELGVEGSELEVTVIDQGPPFNPTEHHKKTCDIAGQVSEGGHGINIMTTVMDKIDYHRTDNANVLIMKKCFCAVATVGSATQECEQ